MARISEDMYKVKDLELKAEIARTLKGILAYMRAVNPEPVIFGEENIKESDKNESEGSDS